MRRGIFKKDKKKKKIRRFFFWFAIIKSIRYTLLGQPKPQHKPVIGPAEEAPETWLIGNEWAQIENKMVSVFLYFYFFFLLLFSIFKNCSLSYFFSFFLFTSFISLFIIILLGLLYSLYFIFLFTTIHLTYICHLFLRIFHKSFAYRIQYTSSCPSHTLTQQINNYSNNR